ncbi:thioesterase [Janibacter melonis]|jgi:acyl-CoA thioesterase FadM|uniref:Thioesterase n=1 Tax=Janibacter melonis TaxID=262209 RepID=A0A5P8FMW8_9MICO|nr:thioesterase family protein [Janibacter melonis]MCB5991117.1 thioesterase family protein [Janibacter melonis]QFQ30907.1 thioesterase [Janibacter melonis]
MSVVARPAVEDVLALPAALVEVAPPEWQDGNGHVNVRRFYDLHMRGAHAALTAIGLDDDYRTSTGQSVFSVEQHIRYLDEVHVGDEVSVHLRWVARGDKVLHAMSFVVDRTTGRVVNVLEMLEAHVDLTTRRACSWAPTLAARIDDAVRAHEELPWPAPTSGAVGVRR